MKKNYGLARQLILSIVIIILILSGLTEWIGYREFTSVLEKQYNDTAYEVAETARNYLNPDKFEEYLETGETDKEYDRIQGLLDELVISSECNFIYVAKIDETDYMTTTYIYDSVNPKTGFGRYPFGYESKDTDPKYVEDLKHILTTGGRAQQYLYSYTESGAHTTAGLGVKNSEGTVVAVIGVEKSMDVLENARSTYVRHVAMLSLVIIALVLVLYTLYLNRTLIQPIREIALEAGRFAENHHEIKKLRAIHRKYEIGLLARSVHKMEIDLNHYIDNLTNVTAEKERISTELNVATQIQADMLPSIFPAFPERKEFDIYATMNPAKEVGGDFYDFFLIDEDHLAMVMADVSGKGVPAALFMVIAKTLIKNRAQMGGGPSEILGYVNNQLCEGNESGMFVTVWLAILEISTGKGVAANAGHEHPAICRADGIYELVVYRHSLAVAAMEGMRFREHTFELHPGDSLYVYTDGVAEATNAGEELFGTDRMLRALNRNPKADVTELLQTVKEEIDVFVNTAPQFDDITMMCLKYYGKEGNPNAGIEN